tara:strand:+ start:802 stop:1041 length:240 start_codon:yes stop_codon:yes gene_type:complete
MWQLGEKTTDNPQHNSVFDAKRADKTIKSCDTCNNCWEIDLASTTTHMKRKNKITYIYYKDFPRYGKPVGTCPRCKTKE